MKRLNKLLNNYDELMAGEFEETVGRQPRRDELWEFLALEDEKPMKEYLAWMIRKDEFIALNTPQWRKEGHLFRRRREELKLNITYCSRQISIAPGTLNKFEVGRYVRNRKLIMSAYHHLIESELAKIRELSYTDMIRKMKKKVS